jgi:hypothetical protein
LSLALSLIEPSIWTKSSLVKELSRCSIAKTPWH